MLLTEKTKSRFGYYPSDLGRGSKKPVVIKCDYCGVECEKTNKSYHNTDRTINKDICKNKECKYKKIKEKNILLYGVENSAQRDDVKGKLSNIDYEKYKDQVEKLAIEGYSLSYISDKLKLPQTSLGRKIIEWGICINKDRSSVLNKTLRDKHGENYREVLGDKLKSISRDKYGVDNPFQAEEVKQKIVEGNIKTLGVSHHLKTQDGINKQRKTVKERYGVNNVMELDESKNSIKATSLRKYGVENPAKNKEVKGKARDTRIKRGLEKEYKGMSVKDMAEKTGFSRTRMNSLINLYGPEVAMKMTPNQSSLETYMEDWLKTLGIEYEKQIRIENRIADFRINSLLIEVDGLFIHSDGNKQYIKSKDYHKIKKDLYIEHGYTPLFFREDEINNKFQIVQSIILNKLGKSRKLYARKCNITTTDKSFFENNHLMGKGSGTIFALEHNGSIVAAMQVRKVKDKNYEISRFCPALHTQVIGGFSRLVKEAERNLDMDSLITFVDLRYGNGDYLNGLGFNKVSEHLSFRWTNGKESIHRMKFPGNSGYDKGFFKIWDCGQAKWVKSRKSP